jgi:(p)ppGpp synthase/HD superfamily hydrolase
LSDQWIIKCFQLADEAHGFKCPEHPEGQRRKWSNQPYIVHPFRVASRTMTLPGVPWSVVCAAVLHDYYEDCQRFIEKYPFIEIPIAVKNLAMELTNTSKVLFPEKNRAARKGIDRERIWDISSWAKAVKLLDRIDNLKDMVNCQDGFKWKYIDETEQLLPYLLTRPDERKCLDLRYGGLFDPRCDEEPMKSILQPLADELRKVISDMKLRMENKAEVTVTQAEAI